MANRAGLRKITKTVRGKRGPVQRSYWVKSSQSTNTKSQNQRSVKTSLKSDKGSLSFSGFMRKHKGLYGGVMASKAAGGVMHHYVQKAGHRDIGSAAGTVGGVLLASHFTNSYKANGKLERDVSRMSRGAKLAAGATMALAGTASHVAGWAAARRLAGGGHQGYGHGMSKHVSAFFA